MELKHILSVVWIIVAIAFTIYGYKEGIDNQIPTWSAIIISSIWLAS